MSSFLATRHLAALYLLAAGLSSLLHDQGNTEAAIASREALFLEKRGLCMALSHTMCQLPLEVQLFALNTAMQFADTYGYRFVGSIPSHDRESNTCTTLNSLFSLEGALLTQQPPANVIVPTFRLTCDPKLFVPVRRACPMAEQWHLGRDQRQVAWVHNDTNVWCSVPEFVERGETPTRCLPGHMSIAQMSPTRLTLKSLLGPQFKPGTGRDDTCAAVVELDAASLLVHANFKHTHHLLQARFRRDLVASTSRAFFLQASQRMANSAVAALRGSGATLASQMTSPPSSSSSSLSSSPVGKGRLRVVLHLVVARAAIGEGALLWHPDSAEVGLAWSVLALQMVLNAWGPDCFEVHLLPTDTLGVSVGPTGYFHHTEPWPDAHVRREREQAESSARREREHALNAAAAAAAAAAKNAHQQSSKRKSRSEGDGYGAVMQAMHKDKVARDRGGRHSEPVVRGASIGRVPLKGLQTAHPSGRGATGTAHGNSQGGEGSTKDDDDVESSSSGGGTGMKRSSTRTSSSSSGRGNSGDPTAQLEQEILAKAGNSAGGSSRSRGSGSSIPSSSSHDGSKQSPFKPITWGGITSQSGANAAFSGAVNGAENVGGNGESGDTRNDMRNARREGSRYRGRGRSSQKDNNDNDEENNHLRISHHHRSSSSSSSGRNDDQDNGEPSHRSKKKKKKRKSYRDDDAPERRQLRDADDDDANQSPASNATAFHQQQQLPPLPPTFLQQQPHQSQPHKQQQPQQGEQPWKLQQPQGKRRRRLERSGVEEDEAALRRLLHNDLRALMKIFPEVDMHVHGSPSTTPIQVVTALASADVAIVAASGISRFVAALARGLVLAPYSRGYPLHAKTLFGKRSVFDRTSNHNSRRHSSGSSSSGRSNVQASSNDGDTRVQRRYRRQLTDGPEGTVIGNASSISRNGTVSRRRRRTSSRDDIVIEHHRESGSFFNKEEDKKDDREKVKARRERAEDPKPQQQQLRRLSSVAGPIGPLIHGQPASMKNVMTSPSSTTTSSDYGNPYALNPDPTDPWPGVVQVSSPHLVRQGPIGASRNPPSSASASQQHQLGGASSSSSSLPFPSLSSNGGHLAGADRIAAKIAAAKRSRLADEGGLWIREAVRRHASSLRVDVLASPSAANGKKPGAGKVPALRDQCLRAAAATSS